MKIFFLILLLYFMLSSANAQGNTDSLKHALEGAEFIIQLPVKENI
jgi:hypothetical protein